MTRPLTVVASLVGALLVVAGVWLSTLSTADVALGDVPAPSAPRAPEPVARATPAPEPALDPEPDPEPDPVPVAPVVTAPTALTIPAIGVGAEVVAVGLEDDGGMEIPEDVATVGWYDPGVAPGEAGSAVLAGHVDSRTQGRGAFFDLVQLELGDTATVTHQDGSTTSWQVTGRANYAKDEAPLPELFRRGGTPQLTLITCGGAFDAGARSYDENIVVILEPA